MYRTEIEKLKKHNSPRSEIDEAYSIWSDEDKWDEDEILQLNSAFLRRTAERMFIPIPEYSAYNDDYEESDITGKLRLTQAAQAKLRRSIRLERKESAEQWLMWMPFLSMLVALMSVVVAALAIVIRH